MPIQVDTLREESEKEFNIQIRPDTHAFQIMRFLAEEPELAFTPKEISEGADVPHGSVSKTLSRLEERDLVQHIDEYWAIGEDDRISSYAASVLSRKSLSRNHESYESKDGSSWEDVPSLGESE